MVENEIWKEINGYEGKYAISNKGNVLSHKHNKILRPQIMNIGYYNVKFGNKTFYIHRLVAEHFIENPLKYPCINHISGNKLDNCVENLEWCSFSHNSKHAYLCGLRKGERPVACMKSGKVLRKYRSAREAELDGFSNQLIARCCKGKRKSHGGYEWKYTD